MDLSNERRITKNPELKLEELYVKKKYSSEKRRQFKAEYKKKKISKNFKKKKVIFIKIY